MNIKVYPSRIEGKIKVPPSKSHTIRALLFAVLAKGKTVIDNLLESEDTVAILDVCQSLGAKIFQKEQGLEIEGISGNLFFEPPLINAHHSGLVLRFFSALAAISGQTIEVTGALSLCERRPVKALIDALKQLGVSSSYHQKHGYAPFTIKGPIVNNFATVEGQDSQPVSALLIALSCLDQSSILCVHQPGEKPWIDMTLFWLEKMGKKVSHQNYEKYFVEGNSYPMNPFYYKVPSDFSSLAFPIATALLAGDAIEVDDIDFNDIQGDKKILSHLIEMGGQLTFSTTSCVAKKSSALQGMQIDMNKIIDAIPIFSVIGCFAKGESVLYNAEVARQKESDRLQAITSELRKMGAHIKEEKDRLTIATSPLKGTKLQSHNDHRIAMALTVAALSAEGESLIEGVECMAKTYPTFIQDMKRIGAKIEVIE